MHMQNVRPTHKDADMSPEEIIRRYVGAYEAKDREMLESVLSCTDFSFSSPDDDHIGRDAYFETCWPMAQDVDSVQIERLLWEDTDVFVQYVMTLKSGKRFRNIEHIRMSGPHIRHIDVYYGRETPGSAA